jgi:hypothetical protein
MIKQTRRSGKAIDVRRFDQRIAIAAERRAQIVNRDEQDVRLRLTRLQLCNGNNEQCGKGAEDFFHGWKQ